MRLCTFLATLYLVAGDTIQFRKIKVTTAPNIMEAYANFDNSTGEWLLNISYTLLKPLNFKIMLLINIYKLEQQKRLKVFFVPKLNYCDLRRKLNNVPLVSDLIREMSKEGDIFPACPIQPGNYSLLNYPIGRSSLVGLFLPGSYYVTYQMLDENRKQSVVVEKVEVYIDRL